MEMIMPVLSGLVGLVFVTMMIVFVVKGFIVKKNQFCPKNQWTTIINNYATAMPHMFIVTFTARDGQAVEGKYIEQRYFGIIPENPKEGALKPQMNFDRYWRNALYKVKIFPTSADLEVKIS